MLSGALAGSIASASPNRSAQIIVTVPGCVVDPADVIGWWRGNGDLTAAIGPNLTGSANFASSIIGLVVGVVILAIRKESRPFPFGPWLALGTVIVILFSGPILRFYGIGDDAEVTLRPPASTSLPVVAGQ